MVKGNSIFALTGLAVAVAKYESSLSSDTEVMPEVSQSAKEILYSWWNIMKQYDQVFGGLVK